MNPPSNWLQRVRRWFWTPESPSTPLATQTRASSQPGLTRPLAPATPRERPSLLALLAPLGFGLLLGSGWIDGLSTPALWWGVAVHECCHAWMTWLTGGRVLSIDLHGLGAETLSAGGIYPLISIAGYTGSALCGAFLLRAASWRLKSRQLALLGMLLAPGLTLVCTGSWNGVWAATLAFSALALLVSRRFSAPLCGFLAAVLFWQNWQDVGVLLFHPELHSDARLLADYLHLPFLALPIAVFLCLVGALFWWRSARAWLRAWRG